MKAILTEKSRLCPSEDDIFCLNIRVKKSYKSAEVKRALQL
jgi:hypothetical protein